eukprot:9199883-Prorocentrum_lima.AAC.1
MTSSLVGSEMCIRDRLSSEHTWISALNSYHQRIHGCPPWTVIIRAYMDCLLYTSDAADDM